MIIFLYITCAEMRIAVKSDIGYAEEVGKLPIVRIFPELYLSILRFLTVFGFLVVIYFFISSCKDLSCLV